MRSCHCCELLRSHQAAAYCTPGNLFCKFCFVPESTAFAGLLARNRGLKLSRGGLAFAGVAVVAVLLGVGAWLYFARKAQALTEKDTIVLSDFTNTTGDAVFDDTLKTALNVSPRQSPFLNVLSDSEVTKTLQETTRPVGTKLTPGHLHDIYQQPFRIDPIYKEEKVVFITPDIAETYAPVRITVAYGGQNPIPKPFVMELLWIKTSEGWKMTTDIPIPLPPEPAAH